MMRLTFVGIAALFGVATLAAEKPAGEFLFPLIPKFGGVVSLPDAAEPPRREAKVVFDITAESKPNEVNRGLESVARYLNLHAQAGHPASSAKVALVLHGKAVTTSMGNEAYQRRTKESQNPNLELIGELKKHGVEVFVCGQSLARSGIPAAEVADDLTVAVSAMTVNVNKQLDGYATVAIH